MPKIVKRKANECETNGERMNKESRIGGLFRHSFREIELVAEKYPGSAHGVHGWKQTERGTVQRAQVKRNQRLPDREGVVGAATGSCAYHSSGRLS